MARNAAKKTDKNGTKGQLGFEAELFLAADKLRKNLEPSDYKHVVLGLIFLKYISDAFEALHTHLAAVDVRDAEDSDQYLAERVFWVPKEARWSHLRANAKQPSIGKLIDDAMQAIEAKNPQIKGVLPKDYGRPALDKVMLGELIDLISNIGLNEEVGKAKDILGRVYEYFLSQFAALRASGEGSFIRRDQSWASSSKCSNPLRAASTTRAADRAACSFNPKSSPRNMAVASATSRSGGRRAITRRGGSAA